MSAKSVILSQKFYGTFIVYKNFPLRIVNSVQKDWNPAKLKIIIFCLKNSFIWNVIKSRILTFHKSQIYLTFMECLNIS